MLAICFHGWLYIYRSGSPLVGLNPLSHIVSAKSALNTPQTIQNTLYNHVLMLFIFKLRSSSGVTLLSTVGSLVRILDVATLNIQVIQGWKEKTQTHWISWNNRWVSDDIRYLSCVTSRHKPSLFSHSWKATLTFFISFLIASCHNVLPSIQSSSNASLTVLGFLMPNLWEVSQYLDFTLDIILLVCLRVKGTQHANVGLASILLFTAYSANLIGCNTFMSFKDTQLVVPSFHITRMFHPLVVFGLCLLPLLYVINAWSLILLVVPSCDCLFLSAEVVLYLCHLHVRRCFLQFGWLSWPMFTHHWILPQIGMCLRVDSCLLYPVLFHHLSWYVSIHDLFKVVHQVL